MSFGFLLILRCCPFKMKKKKLPSLQFVITNRLSLISHLNLNDRSIPLRPLRFYYENSRRYSQLCVYRRWQWQQHPGSDLSVRTTDRWRGDPLKGAQVWDFDPFFYTNKSYMGRWLEDWIHLFFIFSKTTADIRHFGFFAHAEPALKNCLRRLSLR